MKKRNLIFLIGVIIFFATGIAIEVIQPPVETKELTQAPFFILKNIDGESINLDTELSKHKVLLVNFWTTWCRVCNTELPSLDALHKKYRPTLEIIGVNIGQNQALVGQFLKEKGISYTVVFGNEQVARSYGVTGVPKSFLITGADRKIVATYPGAIEKSLAEADISKVLETAHP